MSVHTLHPCMYTYLSSYLYPATHSIHLLIHICKMNIGALSEQAAKCDDCKDVPFETDCQHFFAHHSLIWIRGCSAHVWHHVRPSQPLSRNATLQSCFFVIYFDVGIRQVKSPSTLSMSCSIKQDTLPRHQMRPRCNKK